WRASPLSSSLRWHRRVALRLRQEADDRRGIKVKHLGARELPLAHVIQAQHLLVAAVSTWGDAPLAPEYDDFLRTGGHDARLHPALRLGRLQGVLGVAPRGTRLLQTACRATVRQRWRPVQL